MWRWTVVVALVALTASTAAAAPTATDENRARALELSKQSKDAYRSGRLDDAVKLLLEARELAQEPVLLYNLARAYEALGDAEKALSAYEQYLAEDPNARDRGATAQRVEALRQQIEARRALEKERDEALRRSANRAVTQSPQPPARSPSVVPWIVAGAGAVTVGAGAVLGVVALGRNDDAMAERSALRAEETKESADSFANASTVCFVVGSAILVGGLVWALLDRRASSTAWVRPNGLGGAF